MANLLQNQFERDTELLGRHLMREEVFFIYKITAALNSYSYQAALDLIKSYQEFAKNNSVREQGDPFNLEVDFMEAFCLSHLDNIKESEQICKRILYAHKNRPLQNLQLINKIDESVNESKTTLELTTSHILALKIYAFLIGIMVRGYKVTINPKNCLQQLVNALQPKQMRIYLPEVLGTLTGCKYFKPLRALKALGGQNNQRKAKKLQILASWKYLIAEKEDCVRFKKEALKIWEQQNCLMQTKNCQEELSQLSGKTKGDYIQKLKRLQFFVQRLVPLQTQQKEISKQTLVKWSFPSLISEIQLIQEDLGKSKTKLSQFNNSKLNSQSNQMKQKLRYINEEVVKFYHIYKKQCNGEISNLILNSRFVQEQIKKIRNTLKILSMLRSQRLRYFFNAFQAYYKQIVAMQNISKRK